MYSLPCDVLVVGGGIAGASAALAAARTGRVVLVRSAPGATALSSGGWTSAPPEDVRSALAAAGYEIVATAHALPHPYGELRPYPHAAREHTGVWEGDVLVCGIAGLPFFRAGALARMWTNGAHARAAQLMLPHTPAAGWSIAALAHRLDRTPELLLDAVAAVSGAGTLVLPPVLGVASTLELKRALEDRTGASVIEALGVPPSLPGWRLDGALQRALAGAGVRVQHGEVFAAEVAGGSVRAVHVRPHGASADAVQRIECARIVLATGKFSGAGVAADADFTEPALDLPVWIEHLGELFERPALALAPLEAAGAPLLLAGVRTNAEGAPVNRTGAVVYDNVRVAGAVRAGVSCAALGLGAAALDGWQAGLAP